VCRAVAEHTPSIIVSADYRLAPEHKAPAQFMDSLAVYKWAWHNASSIGGDPKKFFSIGGSAGGTLALALANYIVANPDIRNHIAGCVAIVPATLHWDHVPSEYKDMYKSYDNVGTPIIDKASMETFYTAAGVDPKDANTFVVLNTENHKNFPPTYIVTCEADPLRDDGKVMEACLKKAGVPVKSDYYAGLPHYFWIFPSVTEGQEFVGNLIGGCKWVVGQM
jgi:versiconal hemiacetal acetate esterase